MKYGSAGFNSFGYKAGCAFALGTYAEAMASPKAAQYLCPEDMDRRYMCLHDHSGDGVCHSSANWDGFYRALPVRPLLLLVAVEYRELPVELREPEYTLRSDRQVKHASAPAYTMCTRAGVFELVRG